MLKDYGINRFSEIKFDNTHSHSKYNADSFKAGITFQIQYQEYMYQCKHPRQEAKEGDLKANIKLKENNEFRRELDQT